MANDAPQARELGPGVYQLAGSQRSAHTYLLRGSRRVALIDSGLPTTTDYIEACLMTLGLTRADLDLVLLTHEHIDHSGGAPVFARHAVVGAHPHAASKMAVADDFSMMSRVFDVASEPFMPDLLLTEGSGIDLGGLRLEVVHTPGHCSGSICLYETTQRLLFSGDTIMARGVVGGVLLSGNTSDYISSLQRLQRLRIDMLLPGHGKISTEVPNDLERGVARLHAMLEDSHALFMALGSTEKGFDEVMHSLRDLNIL